MLQMDEDTSLEGLVELYLVRCAAEGKSPHTLRAYGETLHRFLRLVPAKAARDVSPADIYEYLARFAQHSPETRHRYFREVRCWFNWLVAMGYLETTPFRGMRNVRVPQRIVQPLSQEEVSRLLATCDRATVLGRRDYAIVLTLLDTGVRRSELLALRLVDLNLAGGRLRILHGKGDRERVVPFAARCRAALDAYLADRGGFDGPLFMGSDGRGALRIGARVTADALMHMLMRRGRDAGVPRVHPHLFRHTYAHWAISHDARELDLQHLLGHSSPDMVRRYTSSYRSEQAASRHGTFSPGDMMVLDAVEPAAGA